MQPPAYDWWIAHAHEDSAFLLLTEYPDVFEQAVTSRLVQLGRPADQGVLNQAKWRAIWEQDRYGSLSSILQAIQPLAETTYRPLNGPLRLDHRALRDDTGPFPLVGVSAFWAPWAVRHNQGQLDRFAEWAVGAGMTYVRWFGSHDWAGGTDVQTANYFALMERTIELLADHGLRSEITCFTRRHIVSDPAYFVREWASLAKQHPDKVACVEIANEWNHSDNGWEDEEIRALGNVFRERCDTPLALSAAAAPDWESLEDRLSDLYSDGAATITTVHFPRRDNTSEGPWRWVRQPWHAKHGVTDCPSPVIDNEHQRWDKSYQGRCVEVAAAAPLTAFVCGCALSAHHDVYGVFNDCGEYNHGDSGAQLQRVLSTVLPFVPSDIANWQSTRVGNGGGPHPFPGLLDQHWTFEPNPSHGVSRSFAAVHGDQFAMTLTGVRDYVALDDVQPRPYRVLSLATGDEVYNGSGPVRLDSTDGTAFFAVTT